MDGNALSSRRHHILRIWGSHKATKASWCQSLHRFLKDFLWRGNSVAVASGEKWPWAGGSGPRDRTRGHKAGEGNSMKSSPLLAAWVSRAWGWRPAPGPGDAVAADISVESRHLEGVWPGRGRSVSWREGTQLTHLHCTRSVSFLPGKRKWKSYSEEDCDSRHFFQDVSFYSLLLLGRKAISIKNNLVQCYGDSFESPHEK